MKIIGAIVGLMLLFPFVSLSQSISGTVKDDQGKTLPGASITLKKTSDSSIVKIAVSTNTGTYQFQTIPAGKYFVNASFVGYVAYNSSSFEHSGESTTAPAV
ncbi:MAG: carboxypeptidase regulatory-like domain-containing protein, partial [Chitinophagaceae bacterium]